MSDDLLIDEPPVRRRFFSRWFGTAGGAPARSRFWRLIKWTAVVLLLIIVLYYPVGMMLTHEINDDANFSAPGRTGRRNGRSQAVATAAALMDREINQTAWPANDPFFMPGWTLDNMPNFQRRHPRCEKVRARAQDEIGRNRGTSGADTICRPRRAISTIARMSGSGIPANALMPTSTTEDSIPQGIRALLSYNLRLGRQGDLRPRADNLLSALDRIGKDLGDASAGSHPDRPAIPASWIDLDRRRQVLSEQGPALRLCAAAARPRRGLSPGDQGQGAAKGLGPHGQQHDGRRPACGP